MQLGGDTSILFFAGRYAYNYSPASVKPPINSTTSDTTASSLTILLYFLARFPKHAKKIQQELEGVDITDVGLLTALPHFTGTINESMRLLPVALTGNPGSRITPPNGLTIAGRFIPAGVKICTSRYVLGKCAQLSIP